MAAPIERLADDKLASDDAHEQLYDLLAEAQSDQRAETRDVETDREAA